MYAVESTKIGFEADRVHSFELGLEWGYSVKACEGGEFFFTYEFSIASPL
jgi:hypothetical protein